MRRSIALALGLLSPLAAQAQTAPPLSDRQLDTLRGGFDLPGGGTVTLGVVTTTRIDGQEVLRTVFNVQNGPALTVLARTGADGVTPVDAQVGGAGVRSADGTVTLAALPNGVRVELAGDRVDISHLVGQSFGSAVANSADSRTIDVATTVNISLGGVPRDAIGGSGAGIDALALDATARLAR